MCVSHKPLSGGDTAGLGFADHVLDNSEAMKSSLLKGEVGWGACMPALDAHQVGTLLPPLAHQAAVLGLAQALRKRGAETHGWKSALGGSDIVGSIL